ncbi:MAG: hypothetical protein ABI588_06280 [Arenimonas sp.]
MGLISELKRRNVIRMAGLYLVGAWLVVQVSGTLLPMFGAPDWVARSLVILLAIGFVPALVIAWVFELTPQGLKRDADVPAQESIAPQTARRMDRTIIVVLVCALAYFAIDKFVLAPKRGAAAVAQVASAKAAPAAINRSIAVLPFVNFSADPENEFFSDGLSEEILNSLARIDGMQVIGRTSSFQFKGKNEDLRTIGEKLGAASVLEGSVRREGQRARITAQLIRTSDGLHLWSETYDRTLDDTLAVQTDIAERVAGVLNVILDDKQRARMRESGVKNVDAFIAYQKGLKLYDDAHAKPELLFFDTMALANAQFDRATTLEPDFALPYFAKVDRYEHLLQAANRKPAEYLEAQREALKTLALAATHTRDPQQRLLFQAERQMLSDDWRGLPALIHAAFKEPGCNASNWLPVFASAFGYGDEFEDFGARASACDPLNFIHYNTRTTVALATGHPQRALDIVAIVAKSRGGTRSSSASQAIALAMLGRVEDAGGMLDAIPPEQFNESYYAARVIVGRARGEAPAALHKFLQSADRSQSKYQLWVSTDLIEAAHAGDTAKANRLAAMLDARPGGSFVLAVFASACHCGAPFDLAATPNFRARIDESGFRWPPPATFKFPARPQPATN